MMAPPWLRIYVIAKITFQGLLGSRKALYMLGGLAVLVGGSTWAISRNTDASVVMFTWLTIFLLFLVLIYIMAGNLREELKAKTLAPFISAPLTRSEYAVGRFLGVWLPGWLAVSGGYWLLFTYGIIRTEGYQLLRTSEQMMRQFGGDLPEGFGLPGANELALLVWILLSAFFLAASSALFWLSAHMARNAAFVVWMIGWGMVAHWWRWDLPGWRVVQGADELGQAGEAMTEALTWPSLPTLQWIFPIIFSGDDAARLTSYYLYQSIFWAAVFLGLGVWAFRRLDLSRPQ